MRRTNVLFLLALFLAGGAVLSKHEVKAQSGAAYTITDLGIIPGPFPEWDHAHAYGINESGAVVGGSNGGAFLFENGSILNLHDTYFSTQVTSDAFSINSLGDIVGVFTEGTVARGYILSNGVVTPIVPPNSADSSVIIDVNDNLTAVGNCGSGLAFSYSQGVFTYLGTFGGDLSFANAVNNFGHIAGSAYTEAQRNHAFLYDGASMIDLNAIDGAIEGEALAISDQGHVVGYSNETGGVGWVNRAFLYQNGVMQNLGTLAAASTAYGVNNNGEVVGENNKGVKATPGVASSHAFIYKNGVMTDLNDLIDQSSGWELELAWGINDAGQISGWGFRNGLRRAFLLTPVSTSNTPTGENVETTPVDTTGGTTPVTITFGDVTSGGETILTTTATGPPPPSGFKIGNPPVYYNLETTATFTGSATLCINYTGSSYANESNIKLFHYEDGAWVDRTSSVDTASNIICATVTSFSPFAIFEPSFPFEGFFAPINNGGVLNAVKAGSSVPLKFNLEGDRGLSIMASGYPKSVPIVCETSAPVDVVEETDTAGSSGLSYDAASNQYKYAWKTAKNWTGCRQFALKLSDGSTHTANFKFTK